VSTTLDCCRWGSKMGNRLPQKKFLKLFDVLLQDEPLARFASQENWTRLSCLLHIQKAKTRRKEQFQPFVHWSLPLSCSYGGGGGGGTGSPPGKPACLLCWILLAVTPSNSTALSSPVFTFLYSTLNLGL